MEKIQLETESIMNTKNKWADQKQTLSGEPRGHVNFKGLKTLWLNTGTVCNLSCRNCYIESSPTNDSLSFLTKEDVLPYIEEIKRENWEVKTINLTGGEPFINPYIFEILELILQNNFKVMVLTNAYKLSDIKLQKIETLYKNYPDLFSLRISLDHYTKEIHELERGENTFLPTLINLKKLSKIKVPITIAGRSLINEDLELVRAGYQKMLVDHSINLSLSSKDLIIFPEMIDDQDVPEISNNCFKVLNVSPEDQMCSNERMIVKRKGSLTPKVVACTLIAYDSQFELGPTLKESFKSVYLNHPSCSQFCILGGASCS